MIRRALVLSVVVAAVFGTAATRVGAQSGPWSATEQQLVYEVNLARHDPAGYLAGLGLDGTGMLPRPPLALNDVLATAAGFRAADMASTGTLSHQSSDGRTPNEVVVDFGYSLPNWWPEAGNNVETVYMGRVWRLVAAVMSSPDHRDHVLGQAGYAAHREVGVGGSSDEVWWSLLSARREAPSTFLTGVVFADRDRDGRMDSGEGLSGVTITVAGVRSTTTNAGGGWAVAVGSGRYLVSATGPGFAGVARARVMVAGFNVGVNFVSGRAAPVVWEYALCRGEEPTIIGTGGDDMIFGTPGRDVIHGLGGDDTIYGLGGGDLICGGPGHDVLVGGGGRDRLFGGPGDDRLLGGLGDDLLVGGAGYDWGQGGGGSADRCVGLEVALGCER